MVWLPGFFSVSVDDTMKEDWTNGKDKRVPKNVLSLIHTKRQSLQNMEIG